MEYVVTWGGPVEDVSIRLFGPAALDVLTTLVHEAVSDGRWRPAMRVLLDEREIDMSMLTAHDMRQRADFAVALRERLAKPHLAVVVSGLADYGLERMVEGLSDDWRDGDVIDMGLFFTVEEARDWLGRFPAPASS